MPSAIVRLGRYELRRFRSPLAKASIVFVVLVPLLYATIYLTANWDPYGKVDQLPVALVDHDRPVRYQGERISAGADLADNLLEGRAFDWQRTDDADAADGLAHGRYFLVVTIPEDFSANLVSGAGEHPRRARIDIRRDDANGYVIGNVTRSAQASILQAVDQSAQESYFNAVFANLATIRSGLADAADGAGTLADGTRTAHHGAGDLETGSASAASGARRLSDGASALGRGLDTAETGSTSLSHALDQLDTGSGTLTSGARQVAAGTASLRTAVVPPLTALEQTLPGIEEDARTASAELRSAADGAAGRSRSVASDLDQLSAGLADLQRDHPELADDPVFGRLNARIASADDRADEVAARARGAAGTVDEIDTALQGSGSLTGKVRAAKDDIIRLDDGAQRVASGAATLQTGLGRAAAGSRTLATGIATADAGARQLATGAGDLAGGLDTLHEGAASLDRGLDRLETGSATLATQLERAAARIPAVTAEQQADAVQVLSAPAEVDAVVDHPAVYNGRGFAPLFLAVSLWVFGISAFQVVRPLTNRLLTGRASTLRLALAAWAPVAALSTAAGWLMLGAVWLLGLDPVHPVLTLVAVTLGALCFSAIAHLVTAALGEVGASLLLVGLLLQLSASGGTYPGQVLPPFFAAIGPYLPLTYLINAYRVAITGGLTSFYLRDVLVLAAVLLAALALLLLVVHRRRHFRFTRLHPSAAGA